MSVKDFPPWRCSRGRASAADAPKSVKPWRRCFSIQLTERVRLHHILCADFLGSDPRVSSALANRLRERALRQGFKRSVLIAGTCSTLTASEGGLICRDVPLLSTLQFTIGCIWCHWWLGVFPWEEHQHTQWFVHEKNTHKKHTYTVLSETCTLIQHRAWRSPRN